MTRGTITIVGNAGMHLGAYMKGGTIEVSGNASDWIGAEMTDGFIRIRGNAGGQVGAAYRGSRGGMRNGTILIGGTAGLEVGMRMKRGTIVVGGLVRDFAGLQMKGGTHRPAERRRDSHRRLDESRHDHFPRADPAAAHLLCTPPPTTRRSCACTRSTWRRWGSAIPYDAKDGGYQRYTGDTSVPGRGEILVWKPHAS